MAALRWGIPYASKGGYYRFFQFAKKAAVAREIHDLRLIPTTA
jgi:hypothetical protein